MNDNNKVPQKDRIILSNQYAGYLFIDVVNVFAAHYDCELLTGHYDPIRNQLLPGVKKREYWRYRKDKTWARIFTWCVYTLQVFFRLLFVSKHTQLVLVTNPPTVPFLGYFLNRLRGIKYHLVIYDIYPDAMVNFGFIREKGALHNLWSRFNSTLFKHANTIFTLSENMAEKIRTYNPLVKVEVIHNWSDTAHIKPVNKANNSFAIEHGQVNKITVMYSGNMGSTHAVERIADMAKAYKSDPNLGFLLIGEGAKKSIIENLKDINRLDNLEILTYQKAEVFPLSIACADIGIVTLSSGAEDLSVPSKTYNLLAAGVALLVIAPMASELARLVREYDCGVIFQEDQVDEMIGFIELMKNDRSKLDRLKLNAREAANNFTPDNAGKYLSLLNSNAVVS